MVKGQSTTLTVAFQPEGNDKSFRAVSRIKQKHRVGQWYDHHREGLLQEGQHSGVSGNGDCWVAEITVTAVNPESQRCS
ncbi:major tail V domain protein [Escherichia coli p0305293.11]|nr:hypothetical protein [Escherichia coli]ENG46438.1 major tail V domain protein [Escherichia coli p0305293.11]